MCTLARLTLSVRGSSVATADRAEGWQAVAWCRKRCLPHTSTSISHLGPGTGCIERKNFERCCRALGSVAMWRPHVCGVLTTSLSLTRRRPVRAPSKFARGSGLPNPRAHQPPRSSGGAADTSPAQQLQSPNPDVSAKYSHIPQQVCVHSRLNAVACTACSSLRARPSFT